MQTFKYQSDIQLNAIKPAEPINIQQQIQLQLQIEVKNNNNNSNKNQKHKKKPKSKKPKKNGKHKKNREKNKNSGNYNRQTTTELEQVIVDHDDIKNNQHTANFAQINQSAPSKRIDDIPQYRQLNDIHKPSTTGTLTKINESSTHQNIDARAPLPPEPSNPSIIAL